MLIIILLLILAKGLGFLQITWTLLFFIVGTMVFMPVIVVTVLWGLIIACAFSKVLLTWIFGDR